MRRDASGFSSGRRIRVRNLRRLLAIGFGVTCALAVGGASRAARADEGETPAAKKLMNRATAPKPADIDAAVTLDAMLAKKEKSSFSEAKGTTVEGYVIQAEREDDGDFHLVLATAKGETDTRKWVIVEVPPAWQKKAASLAPDALRKLVGSKVRVTGWLFYEPDEDHPDPRGTRWEIHPVTAISVVK
jgi:hypothetical protein